MGVGKIEAFNPPYAWQGFSANPALLISKTCPDTGWGYYTGINFDGMGVPSDIARIVLRSAA